MNCLTSAEQAAHNLRQADLAASNARQMEEARSDDNKYFFFLRYGREGTESELMIYYIDNGGATGHRQRLTDRAAETRGEPPNTPE